ncbi:MAG: dipeptide epimerase [Saprospiraceae bacterium]
MQLTIHPYTLKLKETFTIARGAYSERKVLFVGLSAAGKTGYGEAGEHEYYGVKIDDLLAGAEKLKPIVQGYAFDNPANFHEYIKPHCEGNTFLLAALDEAAHDLYGKLGNKPCFELWGWKTETAPKSCYTLPIDDPDTMLRKLRETDFSIYKVKLGSSKDLEVMRMLRDNTDAILRVDANCAWTVKEAIDRSEKLAELKVEFIEQPLAHDNWEGMKELARHSALPLIADESCRTPDDLERCAEVFNGINIKLVKCGGPTAALKMIKLARSLDLKIMGGCMVESSVAISAMAHLAPALDYLDIDGPLLLANDPASGIRLDEQGGVHFNGKPGFGTDLVVQG